MNGCSFTGCAGFHGLNTGTPDGGGLGFLLKLLLNVESFGNGFNVENPNLRAAYSIASPKATAQATANFVNIAHNSVIDTVNTPVHLKNLFVDLTRPSQADFEYVARRTGTSVERVITDWQRHAHSQPFLERVDYAHNMFLPDDNFEANMLLGEISLGLIAGPELLFDDIARTRHLARVVDNGAEFTSSGRIVAPNSPAFRGEPFAFGKGTRSQRAINLLDESGRASGVRVSDYVDDVLYDATGDSPYFWVTASGRRQIVVDPTTFGKTRAGQLVAGSHELEHALHFDEILRLNNGNINQARQAFFMSNRTNRYAIREVMTESIARERVTHHLNGITPQQHGDSTKYINFWRRRAGF